VVSMVRFFSVVRFRFVLECCFLGVLDVGLGMGIETVRNQCRWVETWRYRYE
jgi:hypothetical protein